MRAMLLVLVAAAATPAAAQNADALFDSAVLHDIRLFINSRDAQQLHDAYSEDTYYQADIEWRGQRVRSVGVRSRGSGSRNPVKPGIRVDFDRYISGQRFLGLKALVLDNLWQDPSLIRESVTMALFARTGQAAPREAYARLFINDVYAGVYAMVEPIDSVFLQRAFDDATGYLFEYRWLDMYYGEYLGDSLEPYKTRFEAKTRTSDGDVALYAPIHDLVRELSRPSDGTWRDAIERSLNARQFLMHVAVEMVVTELDGVMGVWAMNNFYLYRPSGTTEHQFIAWDRDNAFQAVDASVLLRTENNVVFQRLMAYGDLRAFYFEALEACARAAAEDSWLEAQVATRAALIRTAAYEDTFKSFSNDDFDAHTAFLIAFARQRPALVLAEVETLRQSLLAGP